MSRRFMTEPELEKIHAVTDRLLPSLRINLPDQIPVIPPCTSLTDALEYALDKQPPNSPVHSYFTIPKSIKRYTSYYLPISLDDGCRELTLEPCWNPNGYRFKISKDRARSIQRELPPEEVEHFNQLGKDIVDYLSRNIQ